MNRPLPEHGERARYLRGCHCDDCVAAHSRYCKILRNEVHRTGRGRRQDATKVQARIRYWESLGYSHEQLAAAAGVSRSLIDAHATGMRKCISPDRARKIMTARLDSSHIPDYLPIDAAGTRRRLQALMAIGHVLREVADECGIWPNLLSIILNGRQVRVRPATARAVAAVYERWQYTPGSCAKNMERAAEKGWRGPLAWWGEDIDDPTALPLDSESVEKPSAGERRMETLHLADAGVAPQDIAERVGLTLQYVRSIIRAERPVLYRHLMATSVKNVGMRDVA